MKKEFIPYEQALALKELGFDESCFWLYDEKILKTQITPSSNSDFKYIDIVQAPLYQQAFRFFREKYGLIGFISFNEKSTFRVEILPHSNIKLNSYKEKYFDNNGKMWDTYEEAELECLKKLIEIVENGR